MEGILRSFRAAECVLACTTALLLIACGEKKDPVLEDPLDDLSFEEQAKAAAHEFLAIAKANASKSCPRPVLRGSPLPGKAEEDIVAVVEDSSGTDPCSSMLRGMAEALEPSSDDFFCEDWGSSEDGFPPRRLCDTSPARRADGYGTWWSGFAERRAQCAPAMESLARAVAHEDACSPYLPGVRSVMDGHDERFPSLASLIVMTALKTADEGRTQQAAESLLDLVRFSQDLHRGGTSTEEVEIAKEVSSAAISALERVLDRTEPLGAPLLAQIDKELAVLIASAPLPSEFLVGGTASSALYGALPMTLGPRWSPPGKRIGEPSGPSFYSEKTGRQWLVALRGLKLAFERACGPTDSNWKCVQRMEALAAEASDRYPKERKSVRQWLDWIRDPKSAPPTGYTPLSLFVVAGGDYANRVREHGQTQFYLGALRLLAKYRALAEETQSCPGLEAFDRPDFADARIDPYSGKPLRVQEIGAGRFIVSSPAKLELGPYPNDAITIRVKCPFAAEKKPPADGGV
jgi:hypothetical protein